MGILSSVANQVANTSAPATTGAKAKRKPAEFWLNIGIELPNPSAGQDGESDTIFLKLPFNLALDDMSALEIRGTNQKWLQEAQARNILLDVVKGEAAKLAQGESKVASELQVQLFRRSADAAPNEDENPLLAAMSKLFQ